jgi:hypothetical protein
VTEERTCDVCGAKHFASGGNLCAKCLRGKKTCKGCGQPFTNNGAYCKGCHEDGRFKN